jgi:hypothetical protein
MKTLGILILASALVMPTAAVNGASNHPAEAVPGLVDASIFGRSMAGGVVVASGRLIDASGRPSSGTIAVLAWPSAETNRGMTVGQLVPTPTVGWARTDSDGRFTLRVDPRLVPTSAVNADGAVSLEAVAWTGTSEGHWSFPANATTDAGGELGGPQFCQQLACDRYYAVAGDSGPISVRRYANNGCHRRRSAAGRRYLLVEPPILV